MAPLQQVLLRVLHVPAKAASTADDDTAPVLTPLLGHRRGVHAVAATPTRCLSASRDALRLWCHDGGERLQPLQCVTSPAGGAEIASAALLSSSSGACTMLCGDRGGGVAGFDAESGACVLRIQAADVTAFALCPLLAGSVLAVGSATRVRVYDMRTLARDVIATLHRPHSGLATYALAAPPACGGDDDSGCMLSAGGDGGVALWDARAWGAPLQRFASDARAPALSVAADCAHVAAGYADGSAAVWWL